MFRRTNLATAFVSLLICCAAGSNRAGNQPQPAAGRSKSPSTRCRESFNSAPARTRNGKRPSKARNSQKVPSCAPARSAVKFMIGDDQTVTLDRLGTIQILRANFENGKVFTDLGMKYGRTRYDIESTARDHDAKVRSPSSVLAVRGTKFISEDQPPFAPRPSVWMDASNSATRTRRWPSVTRAKAKLESTPNPIPQPRPP